MEFMFFFAGFHGRSTTSATKTWTTTDREGNVWQREAAADQEQD